MKHSIVTRNGWPLLTVVLATAAPFSALGQDGVNDPFGSPTRLGLHRSGIDDNFAHGGPGVGVIDAVSNFDVSMSGYDLLNTSLKIESDDNVVKVLFTPWRLSAANNGSLLENTKVNLAKNKEALTIGLGSGWNTSSVHSERGKKLVNAMNDKFKDITSGSKQDDQAVSDVINELYEDLAWKATQVTAGLNFGLFDALGGDEVDADGDSLIDNFNAPLQGFTGTLTGTQNFRGYERQQASLSLSGFYSELYDGASEKFKQRVPRLGWTLTATQMLFAFQTKEEYRKGKNYTSTLFVPGITLGVSLQFMKALDELSYVKNGVERENVTTVFIDIKITPQSQLRLGVPIKRTTSIEGKEVAETRTFFQYSLTLADLTK